MAVLAVEAIGIAHPLYSSHPDTILRDYVLRTREYALTAPPLLA
jgi:hypothetical protein